MKKIILVVAAIVVLSMFFSSCKTADFVWNPVGMWSMTVTGDWGEVWTETLTFTGNETAGVFNGWTNYNPSITPGTWTKAGFTLTINLDCNNGHWRNVLTFTGTSSEAGPNSMTGTGNWLEYYYGSYTDTYTMTFTAVKTTNLQ
jgi:hypothetical protein